MRVFGDSELESQLQSAAVALQFGRLLNNRTWPGTRTSVVPCIPWPGLRDHHRDTRQQQDGEPAPTAYSRFQNSHFGLPLTVFALFFSGIHLIAAFFFHFVEFWLLLVIQQIADFRAGALAYLSLIGNPVFP